MADLMPLESREFTLDLEHPRRVCANGDRLKEQVYLGRLARRENASREHIRHPSELLGAGELPRYRPVALADRKGSSVTLTDELEHGGISFVHADANPGSNVVVGPPLARYVDAPLPHEEAGELVVELVTSHGDNHTGLEV